VHIDTYGIVKAGQSSELGRDSAFVEQFEVGKTVFHHVPVSIFERAAPKDQGMLGIRWLVANRVVIDYQKKVVVLNPNAQATAARTKELLSKGYVMLPMKRGLNNRYLLTMTINGIEQDLVVSTVSANLFDSEFAKRAHFKLTATDEIFGGPSGATGPVYKVSKPIIAQVAGLSLTIKKAEVQDYVCL
jgi:hypothetical protein